jgi:cephalosporin hydroxylase
LFSRSVIFTIAFICADVCVHWVKFSDYADDKTGAIGALATRGCRVTVHPHRKGIEEPMTSVAVDGFLANLSADERELVDQFLALYYNARYNDLTWANTMWRGVKTLRCPLDLWLYQEIIFETRPDLIIETGTANGGGALYLASLCEMLQCGEVVSVDIRHPPTLPKHAQLTYLTGSSVDPGIVANVEGKAKGAKQVLVILDSDHSCPHVLAELRAYAPLVRNGGYLIVEDTIVNGHPIRSDFGPGPMEAIEEFLSQTSDWVIDRTKEKFLLSFNRNGYLKRVR